MKDRISALILALALLPAFAHADSSDAINRLEMQVEMLTDQVARLRSEVDELKRQRHVQKPVSTEPAATGTYRLDPEDIESVITRLAVEQSRTTLDAAEPETRKQMIAGIRKAAREQADKMRMKVILHADGTFETTGQFYDQMMNASGTWAQKGSKLEIATTMEGGIRHSEPVRKYPRLVDGDLVFPPDDELTFELILRRQGK